MMTIKAKAGSQYPAVMEFMKNRRSVPAKTMGGPGPDQNELLEIVEVASRVPDHGKIAPWRFLAYGEGAKNRIGEAILARALALNPAMNDEQREIELTRMSRSPQVVALFSKPVKHPKVPQWEQILSSGAVGMNMLIAANALGYDAQWLTEWYAFDESLHAELGGQEGEKIAGFFHFGTKTMPKTERERPALKYIFSIIDK